MKDAYTIFQFTNGVYLCILGMNPKSLFTYVSCSTTKVGNTYFWRWSSPQTLLTVKHEVYSYGESVYHLVCTQGCPVAQRLSDPVRVGWPCFVSGTLFFSVCVCGTCLRDKLLYRHLPSTPPPPYPSDFDDIIPWWSESVQQKGEIIGQSECSQPESTEYNFQQV